MIRFLGRRSAREVEALTTSRLRLEPMTSALLNAEAHDNWHLGEALKVRVAGDWPPELWDPGVRAHIVAQLTAQPETVGWHRYIVLEGGAPLLIGCIGAFPCAAGDVELGYSVASSQQRRGYATEAAGALISWLLQRQAVHSVSAQAYESSPGSVKVMQGCGMRCVGAGEYEGTVRYRRWR